MSRKEFERELKRTEELMARDQSHATELILKAKELQDCEAARF